MQAALPPGLLEATLHANYEQATAHAGAQIALRAIYQMVVNHLSFEKPADATLRDASCRTSIQLVAKVVADSLTRQGTELERVVEVSLQSTYYNSAVGIATAAEQRGTAEVPEIDEDGKHHATEEEVVDCVLASDVLQDVYLVARGNAEMRLREHFSAMQTLAQRYVAGLVEVASFKVISLQLAKEQYVAMRQEAASRAAFLLRKAYKRASAQAEEQFRDRIRGPIESLVSASISDGVAKSREVAPDEVAPDTTAIEEDFAFEEVPPYIAGFAERQLSISPETANLDAEVSESGICAGIVDVAEMHPGTAAPVADVSESLARAGHIDSAEVSAETAAPIAEVVRYEPPASADSSSSTPPTANPPWSAASDLGAPPATAPGGLSSMTGLEPRTPEAPSTISRQESFKVLWALYGPAADQKLAQRQSVSAGSAWSTRSAWSAGVGISTTSTAPSSLQPTPPSTAPPASRVAARAKCRAVRKPQAQQYDDKGSHLVHKKYDPNLLRQVDQDRLRQRFMNNMDSIRHRESKSRRREGVLQEYYWRMRDMEAEVGCRKQEVCWKEHEQKRRQDVEKRRQALAGQSDEALNRRYGRFYIGPPDSQSPSSAGKPSRPTSIQKMKESEMESMWEAEDLNVFQEAYQDAVGRIITPNHDRRGSGELRELRERRQSRVVTRPQAAATSAPARPRMTQMELTWQGSLRSPMASPNPSTQSEGVQQRAVSSSAAPSSRTPSPGERTESKSTAAAPGPPVHVSKALPAGLVEWESWRNPWRGRRRGAPPSVEAVVSSMLSSAAPASGEEGDHRTSLTLAAMMGSTPYMGASSQAVMIANMMGSSPDSPYVTGTSRLREDSVRRGSSSDSRRASQEAGITRQAYRISSKDSPQRNSSKDSPQRSSLQGQSVSSFLMRRDSSSERLAEARESQARESVRSISKELAETPRRTASKERQSIASMMGIFPGKSSGSIAEAGHRGAGEGVSLPVEAPANRPTSTPEDGSLPSGKLQQQGQASPKRMKLPAIQAASSEDGKISPAFSCGDPEPASAATFFPA